MISALLVAATLGQFLGPSGGVDSSPYKKRNPIVFSFTAPAPGAYASITPTVGGVITCTRASTATYLDGTGTRQTAPPNTCRVETTGLKIEGLSTNYLLNSNTPATQTTASLGTGSYTGWVEGTGSLAFAVGTAVATGLPCTATTGVANDCHFSITTAGTIVATLTGSLTAEQLEPQPFRTSYIATGGTAVTRSADLVSTPKPAAMSFQGDYSYSVIGFADGIPSGDELLFGSDANYSPYLRLAQGAGSLVSAFGGTPGAPAQINPSDAYKQAANKYVVSQAGPTLTLSSGGLTASTTPGTRPADPTTLYLGAHGGGSPLFGHISTVRVCKTSNAAACQ